VKRTLLIIALLGILLLLSSCAGTVATTTSSVSSARASSTTLVDSTSTTGTTIPIMDRTYTAELSGKEVVPEVDTSATGTATFTVDATGTRVHFVLKVSAIIDATAARVHAGQIGSNGQGLLILFPGPTKSGNFTGVLAEGNFSASALIGSLTGKTIVDFVALVKSGSVYVNVGTLNNPKGEIRGQLR
jgi:hypothetical protein